jgi:hypothetical protein
MGEQWIIVPNWDKFQHYTDRDPPWIKLWTGLNSDPDWDRLTLATRGMLTTIWVEYARSSGQLTRGKCMETCGKSARSEHLKSLNDAGFIELSASRPPRREEKGREEKKEAASANEKSRPVDNNGQVGLTACPECGVRLAGPRKLAEHRYVIHTGPEPAHWVEAERAADLG